MLKDFGIRAGKGLLGGARRFGSRSARAAGAAGTAARVASAPVRAASRTTSGRRIGKAGIYGGAAAIGVGAAITDKDSRWGDIQQDLTGERNIFGYSMKAGIANSMRAPDDSILDKPHRHYYGRPYNTRAGLTPINAPRLNAPRVDGAVNFGLWDQRRG